MGQVVAPRDAGHQLAAIPPCQRFLRLVVGERDRATKCLSFALMGGSLRSSSCSVARARTQASRRCELVVSAHLSPPDRQLASRSVIAAVPTRESGSGEAVKPLHHQHVAITDGGQCLAELAMVRLCAVGRLAEQFLASGLGQLAHMCLNAQPTTPLDPRLPLAPNRAPQTPATGALSPTPAFRPSQAAQSAGCGPESAPPA